MLLISIYFEHKTILYLIYHWYQNYNYRYKNINYYTCRNCWCIVHRKIKHHLLLHLALGRNIWINWAFFSILYILNRCTIIQHVISCKYYVYALSNYRCTPHRSIKTDSHTCRSAVFVTMHLSEIHSYFIRSKYGTES